MSGDAPSTGTGSGGGGLAGPPPPPHVVIYSRAGCHLCEQALDVLRPLSSRVAFTLTEVDIESDERLLARYLERIPVITIDGREAFELLVDGRELELAITRARLRAAAG